MTFLHTSDRVGEADALLKEASQKVQEFRSTLDPESCDMAEGLIQFSRYYRAGLENKNMLRRHEQAQEYLESAKETHEKIMQLTLGLYH